MLARQTGIQLSRESVREVLKKKTEATAVPRGGLLPPPLSWRGVRLHWPPWSIRPGGVRSFEFIPIKPSVARA